MQLRTTKESVAKVDLLFEIRAPASEMHRKTAAVHI